MDRIDYLDGWRGLAIGMVLVAHFTPVPQMDFGRFGVDLFFVLSGLLMARILFEKRTPIPEFYRRRISRILPGFVAFLTIVLGAEALRGVKVTASEVLSLATFTRTYIGEFMWSDPLPVAQIWSLNVEEHCYLVLSLVAAIAMLFKRAALVLLALALATFPAIVIYHHLSTDPSSAYMLRTECAATCLMLSASYRLMPKRSAPGWMVPAALVIAVGCYAMDLHPSPKRLFAPFLLAFAINHLEGAPAWLLATLRLAWLRWLGVVSYSVYLWQQPFHDAGLNPVIALAGALAAGSASFYLLERPAREWLNTHWRSARAAATPGGPTSSSRLDPHGSGSLRPAACRRVARIGRPRARIERRGARPLSERQLRRPRRRRHLPRPVRR